MGNLTGWHALILLAVVLLLFGASRLPALARSVGQSLKIFQKEARTPAADGEATPAESVPEEAPVAERG